MAEYVTLKKPDGTVIYPQSVIGQVADGSVTGDMIANDTVTSDNIDWTTLAQSLSTSSTSTDYFQIGDLLICFGVGSGTNSSTPTSVTFPKNFAYRPKVFASPLFQEGGNSRWTAWPASITTSGATFQIGWVNPDNQAWSNAQFSWLAIGKAAS